MDMYYSKYLKYKNKYLEAKQRQKYNKRYMNNQMGGVIRRGTSFDETELINIQKFIKEHNLFESTGVEGEHFTDKYDNLPNYIKLIIQNNIANIQNSNSVLFNKDVFDFLTKVYSDENPQIKTIDFVREYAKKNGVILFHDGEIDDILTIFKLLQLNINIKKLYYVSLWLKHYDTRDGKTNKSFKENMYNKIIKNQRINESIITDSFDKNEIFIGDGTLSGDEIINSQERDYDTKKTLIGKFVDKNKNSNYPYTIFNEGNIINLCSSNNISNNIEILIFLCPIKDILENILNNYKNTFFIIIFYSGLYNFELNTTEYISSALNTGRVFFIDMGRSNILSENISVDDPRNNTGKFIKQEVPGNDEIFTPELLTMIGTSSKFKTVLDFKTPFNLSNMTPLFFKLFQYETDPVKLTETVALENNNFLKFLNNNGINITHDEIEKYNSDFLNCYNNNNYTDTKWFDIVKNIITIIDKAQPEQLAEISTDLIYDRDTKELIYRNSNKKSNMAWFLKDGSGFGSWKLNIFRKNNTAENAINNIKISTPIADPCICVIFDDNQDTGFPNEILTSSQIGEYIKNNSFRKIDTKSDSRNGMAVIIDNVYSDNNLGKAHMVNRKRFIDWFRKMFEDSLSE